MLPIPAPATCHIRLHTAPSCTPCHQNRYERAININVLPCVLPCVLQVVMDAIADARAVCTREYGSAPDVGREGGGGTEGMRGRGHKGMGGSTEGPEGPCFLPNGPID